MNTPPTSARAFDDEAAADAPHAPHASRLERIAFAMAVALGCSIYWLSPWLPMVDAPQHAAQVQMLLELWQGTFAFPNEVFVNRLTPYWLGYAATAFFALVLPVAEALKLVMTVSFLGFVAAWMLLRRQSGGRPWWDWLVLPGFFGMAHEWGFINFLVAVPLGLLYITWSISYAERPTNRKLAWKIALLGAALFFCHILIMALAVGLGALITALRLDRRSSEIRQLLPFAAGIPFVVAWFALVFINEDQSRQTIFWHMGLHRITELPTIIAGIHPSPLVNVLVAALFALPFLAGARITPAWEFRVPLIAITLILLLLPSTVPGSFFTYQRFAVFLAPLFLIALRSPRNADGAVIGEKLSSMTLALGTVLLLLLQASKSFAFGLESQPFKTLLAKVAPNERVLSLPIDRGSVRAIHPAMYLHFPVWYQTQKGGLVDFNFAWFVAQPVRYKFDQRPPADPTFVWHPAQMLDSTILDGADYRYIIVRSGQPLPEDMLKQSRCQIREVFAQRPWWLYERACSSAPLAPK